MWISTASRAEILPRRTLGTAAVLNEMHPPTSLKSSVTPIGGQNTFDLIDQDMNPMFLLNSTIKQKPMSLKNSPTKKFLPLEEMAPDDAADLLGDLEDDQREEILELWKTKFRRNARTSQIR